MSKQEKVMEFLSENIEVLREVVGDINGWNGALEHLDFHENNEDFFNTYFYKNPDEAVRAAFYGEYKYMDEYVRFNGYGNLESLSEYDVEQELLDNAGEVAEHLIDLYGNLSIENSELIEIIESDEE